MKRQLLIGLCVLAGLLLLFYLIHSILAPLLISLALAYLLDPVVEALAKRRVPRAVSALVMIVVAAAIIVTVLLILIPRVVHQVRAVAEQLPAYSVAFKEFAHPYLNRLDQIYPGGVESLLERLKEAAKSNAPKLIAPIGDLLTSTFSSAVGLIVGLLNIIMIPVMTFYLLQDFPRIRAALVELVPPDRRGSVVGLIHEIDRVLSGWVRGQLTVCTILSCMYGIGLSLIGVPMPLLWALVGGFGNLIPYVGTITSAGGSILFTFLQYHSLRKVLETAIVFMVVQLLEGTVIGPRIVGKSVGLNPVIMIVGVIVGGDLLGFVGMLLAVPAMAVGSVLLKRMRGAYLQTVFYRSAGPSPSPPAS